MLQLIILQINQTNQQELLPKFSNKRVCLSEKLDRKGIDLKLFGLLHTVVRHLILSLFIAIHSDDQKKLLGRFCFTVNVNLNRRRLILQISYAWNIDPFTLKTIEYFNFLNEITSSHSDCGPSSRSRGVEGLCPLPPTL